MATKPPRVARFTDSDQASIGVQGYRAVTGTGFCTELLCCSD